MILILDPMDATDASALKVEVLALKDCARRLSKNEGSVTQYNYNE